MPNPYAEQLKAVKEWESDPVVRWLFCPVIGIGLLSAFIGLIVFWGRPAGFRLLTCSTFLSFALLIGSRLYLQLRKGIVPVQPLPKVIWIGKRNQPVRYWLVAAAMVGFMFCCFVNAVLAFVFPLSFLQGN